MDKDLNLRGFFNHFYTLLSDDQRPLYSYSEAAGSSILLMQGVVVLTVQPAVPRHYDAVFTAMQVKEQKVYRHGARLLEHFADYFLPSKQADDTAYLNVALYGAGFQCVLPITTFGTEPQHAQGTIMRKDKEQEVSRVCGVIIRRKQ